MSNPETGTLKDQEYLGDGVYAGHDGYHIVLWLLDPGAYGPLAIALEPPVMRRLEEYERRIGANAGPSALHQR